MYAPSGRRAQRTRTARTTTAARSRASPRRDVLHVPHERGVARRAEADVVREDGGAEHVAVAMNGVDAVEQRDPEAGLQRRALEAVDHVGPRRGVILRRGGPAAREDAA